MPRNRLKIEAISIFIRLMREANREISQPQAGKNVAGACRNRTHPSPKDDTLVLKTKGHTSTHSLPNVRPLYLLTPGEVISSGGMELEVNWAGGLAFETTPPSGATFVMDSTPEFGGTGRGPSPVEALLAALAGCTGMDVISILQKKKQIVTGYRISVIGERPGEDVFPRPFTRITVTHHISGENVDPAAVARAIELSETKYCKVMATLQASPEIVSRFEID